MLSGQANVRSIPCISQLEPPRDKSLEHLTRVIFLRSSLDLVKCHIPIAAERILILEGVVDVLEVLQCSCAMQVSGQIGHDTVGQGADPRIEFGAVPGHVEEEDYIVILITVQAQDIPASLQAVLSENPRQRLELDRGIDEERIFFVKVELII